MRTRTKDRLDQRAALGFARVGKSNVPRPLSPAERRRIEALVARLIDMLDQADGDPDLEPSLGYSPWLGQGIVDLESDDEDNEPDADDEPSLGSPETVPNEEIFAYRMSGDVGVARDRRTDQSRWSDGSTADLEDEHDGREPDVDDEPSLGSLNVVDQHSWSIGATDDG